MLRSLTDVAIAFIELLEVEARQLGHGLQRVGLSLAFMWVAACVAAAVLSAAAGFLIWSLYLTFLAYFKPAAAALLTGTALFVVIGVAGWIAVNSMRRRSSR